MIIAIDALQHMHYIAPQHPLDVISSNSSFGGYLPRLTASAFFLALREHFREIAMSAVKPLFDARLFDTRCTEHTLENGARVRLRLLER